MSSIRSVPLFLAVFLLSASSLAQNHEAIPIRLAHGRFPIVSVRINGQGPFSLLIDTGSTTTIVNKDLALRLALTPTDRSRVTSSTNRTTLLTRAIVQNLEVGTQRVDSLKVLLADVGNLRRIGKRLDGALGQNFLSQFDVLIDYRDKRLLLGRGDALHHRFDGTHVPFTNDARGIRVSVTSNGQQRRVQLKLDSGANGLVLFEKESGKPPLEIELSGRTVKLSSTNGSRVVNLGSIRGLQVGGTTLRNVPAALVPARDRYSGGLLPTGLFSKIYICYEKQYVIFNPDRL